MLPVKLTEEYSELSHLHSVCLENEIEKQFVRIGRGETQQEAIQQAVKLLDRMSAILQGEPTDAP